MSGNNSELGQLATIDLGEESLLMIDFAEQELPNIQPQLLEQDRYSSLSPISQHLTADEVFAFSEQALADIQLTDFNDDVPLTICSIE